MIMGFVIFIADSESNFWLFFIVIREFMASNPAEMVVFHPMHVLPALSEFVKAETLRCVPSLP